jgi:hypothetical protein
MDTNTTTPQVLEGFVEEAALAPQFKKSLKTLVRWRKTGKSPKFTIVGREVYYSVNEGDRCVAERCLRKQVAFCVAVARIVPSARDTAAAQSRLPAKLFFAIGQAADGRAISELWPANLVC